MRSIPRHPVVLAALILCLLAPAAGARASAQERTDSLRAELDRLRARMDSLEAVIRQLQEGGREEAAEEAGDALAELRAAAQAAADRGAAADTADERPATFTGRQRSLQALNPEISVNADILAHVETDDPDSQNFVPREFEVSFQSSLDPFSQAKIFLGVHNPGPELVPFGGHGEEGEEGEEGHGEGPDIGVEEGYVEWVGLPGGLNLKLGRFFQRFGALNRWHSHALPFQSRSLPHLAFIGEEPLAQTGASLSWLVPLHGAGAYEATVEVTRSSNEVLFGESARPSVLGNVNAFWQLSEATDLDLSFSWLNGTLETETALLDRDLFGTEMAFTWLPPGRSRYRGVTVRAGAMLLDGLETPLDEGDEEGGDRAWGAWSLADVRLGRQWLAGARFDWTENPGHPDETAWLVSPTLTWWQSEYVRLRLEYDLLARSAVEDDEGRLWLQVTFAMGPHKHETY